MSSHHHQVSSGVRAGALNHHAILNRHVVRPHIGGAAWQDLALGDGSRHRPGRIGDHRGEGPFEAGRRIVGVTRHDPHRMHGPTVLPVDHDGGGGVHLDPFRGDVSLQPTAAFQIQRDLASAGLGRNRERPLCRRADAGVRFKTVAHLERPNGLLHNGAVFTARRADHRGGGFA